MKVLLKRFMRSKKFVATLVGLISAPIAVKLGVETEVVKQMLTALAVYVGAQGIADAGMGVGGGKKDDTQ